MKKESVTLEKQLKNIWKDELYIHPPELNH